MDLSINLAPNHSQGLILQNPVMIASGTFGYDGYGRGIPEDVDLSLLGAIIPKTVTRYPRVGNPEPRWYPTSYREGRSKSESVYLNSIGLENPGIDHALSSLAPLWAEWTTVAILSISGSSPSEFAEMANMTNGVRGFEGIELNLSCPNVESGALFAHSADLTNEVVRKVRSNCDKPILVKLAPNVPDIIPIAQAAEAGGADALTLCNTNPAMLVDVSTQAPVLGAVTGGLSGPGLHPIALALVYQAFKTVRIPIVGVGGIFTVDDALRFLMCGATGIQVGSANLADLRAPITILRDLTRQLEAEDNYGLDDVIGISHIKTATTMLSGR